MPEKSRREELLRDSEATLESSLLTGEFISEHILLMERFDPLKKAIATGEIKPDKVALSVLEEHARLAKLHRAAPKTTS